MEIIGTAVALNIAIIASCITASVIITGRGTPSRTPNRTVEHYHGCQSATWHTPLESRLHAAAGVLGLLTAFPGTVFVVLGIPLLTG